MIYPENSVQKEVRQAMRGGKGEVVIEHLAKPGLPPNARLVAKITLGPGSSIGEHRHEAETELFYFLAGSGRVLDDGQPALIQAGDSMVTASGHSHAVENTGTEPLVMLAVIVKD